MDVAPLPLEKKIKLLIAFYHCLFIYSLFHLTFYMVGLGLVSYLLFGKIGAEIGLHRYFSHRSFQTGPWRERILLVLAVFAGLGSPISWAATHRLHHMNADTEKDPHSPLFQSPAKIWLTLWLPFVVPGKLISDISQKPIQRWVHKYYFKIHLLLFSILSAINLPVAVIVFSWPCVFSFHLAGAVNVLCHKPEVKNHMWLNWIGIGDALHANHHENPSSYSTSGAEGGFDFSGLIVRYIFAKRGT